MDEDGFFAALADTCLEHMAAIGLCTAAVFLLSFLYLRIRRHRLSRLYLDSGELGTVSVAPAAIREIVGAICSNAVPDSRAKIAVRSRSGRLHVRVKLRIPMGRNVCATAKKIQNTAAACLKAQFGIDNFYGIDVIIGGFRGPYATSSECAEDGEECECCANRDQNCE